MEYEYILAHAIVLNFAIWGANLILALNDIGVLV